MKILHKHYLWLPVNHHFNNTVASQFIDLPQKFWTSLNIRALFVLLLGVCASDLVFISSYKSYNGWTGS